MIRHDGPRPVVEKKKRRGATAVEYLFVLTLIFVVCIATIQQFGQTTKKIFENNAEKIEEAGKPTP